ncbi:Dyp-type peroxidase [Bradyrhizobium japonicum]|uniref:Dyp-type peroxidase n=1 Tax=Bradyrhizobium japonicum TaxID=375 RepID=UPI002714930B|nr:Dyp-type peroxidase domain-containing protein [Bradyrhizobium japonicum]WLB53897.1 Dyp-type peroxidase [Bradyrhizobium japonicum]WLB64230.1 Dyp-type peroxidase [Bradyrhizobium japonicum]
MKVPHLSDQLDDIQGMIGTGYGWLYTSRFWLLTIRDGSENQARKWLSGLAHSGLVGSAAHVRESRAKPIKEAVAIAFSYSGLTKLGFKETEAHPFPSPFRSGMGSDLRALLLKDRYRQWRWSDVDGAVCGPAHALIAEWSERGARPPVPDIDKEVFCSIKIDNDPCAFHKGNGDEEERLREAFGFRDGLAQPVIRGLRVEESDGLKRAIRDAGTLYDDRVVAPGEFILGYRNEYGELTYCPNLEGWTGDAGHSDGRFGLNGSYLAVRQIQQDVKAFEEFRAAKGKEFCEKLMGRREDGKPLSWKGDPDASVSDSEADAFRFRVDDGNGFGCPKGAHIRRVNPRDSLGIDVKSSIKSTKLHRLLRRGRPYLEQRKDEAPRKGIFFIACNADLERQFEFIHQRWVRNPNFGCLHDQDDPVVGSAGSHKKFSIPGLPSGDELSLEALTQTLGGGYFFLPGIKALQFIVEHGAGMPLDDPG